MKTTNTKSNTGKSTNSKAIAERLEYLRGEIRQERISCGELAELQSLRAHIPATDTELLEAAGVPEDLTQGREGAKAKTAGKHTPGPWKAEMDDRRKFGGNLNLYISTDYKPGGLCDGSRSIAAITGMARGEKEIQSANMANARLIAAAPELAEMLDCLVDDLTEAHADELNSDHHGDGAEGCSYCRNIAKARALLAKATTPGV